MSIIIDSYAFVVPHPAQVGGQFVIGDEGWMDGCVVAVTNVRSGWLSIWDLVNWVSAAPKYGGGTAVNMRAKTKKYPRRRVANKLLTQIQLEVFMLTPTYITARI